MSNQNEEIEPPALPPAERREDRPTAPVVDLPLVLHGAAIGEQHFRRLYEQYHGTVYGFFVNRDFSYEDARDLAAETFFQAFSGLDGFRGDSSFSTWLYGITVNVWRNSVRKLTQRRRTGAEVSFEEMAQSEGAVEASASSRSEPTDAEPLERILEEERTRLVRAAIDELPEPMRLCLLLRLDQGLRYREIAKVLQISTDSVRSKLHQARNKLRRRLGDHFED